MLGKEHNLSLLRKIEKKNLFGVGKRLSYNFDIQTISNERPLMQFSVRMELHKNSMIDKHFSIYEKSLAVVVVGVVKDLNYPKMNYNHPNKNFVIYDSF